MNEENNRSEASELDGLPDADRKETEEILSDIAKDEKKEGDEQSGKEPEKKEEKSAEDVAKEAEAAKAAKEAADKSGKDGDGKDGKPDSGKQEPARRPPKLMPTYVHEIAQKEAQKKIDDLEKALEEAKAGKGSESEQQRKPDAEQQAQLETRIKEVAEKHKLTPDTVKDLVSLGMEFGGKLPKEVEEKLRTVDEWKSAQEIQAEEQAFSSAFDEYVVPLLKKEYGDNVAADTITEIRKKMKEVAYTKEFAATPYSVIYKGVDDFRKFTRTTGASAEESRGGAHGAGEDDKGGAAAAEEEQFANATDADIDKMDGPTFDRFSAWQQRRERAR